MAEIAVRHMTGDRGDVSTMELVGASRTWILRKEGWASMQEILDRVHELNRQLQGKVPKGG